MKRLTLLALALAIGALVLPGRATDVLWSYGDFSQTIQTNRALDLYPVCVAATNSAGITAMDRITVKTGSDGTVTTTGIMPGFCEADFHGVWVVTPRWFLIPNTNGLVYARDCILTNGLPPPIGAPTLYWSKGELVPGINTTFRTNSGKVFIDTLAGGGSGTGGVSVAASAPLVASTNNGLVTLSAPTVATASDVNAATQALGTALSARMLTNGASGAQLTDLTITGSGLFASGAVSGNEGYFDYGTVQGTWAAGSLMGDGSAITGLNGANLQVGTVNSNALDAGTAAQLALAGTGTDGGGLTNGSSGTNISLYSGTNFYQIYSRNGNGTITSTVATAVAQIASAPATAWTSYPVFGAATVPVPGNRDVPGMRYGGWQTNFWVTGSTNLAINGSYVMTSDDATHYLAYYSGPTNAVYDYNGNRIYIGTTNADGSGAVLSVSGAYFYWGTPRKFYADPNDTAVIAWSTNWQAEGFEVTGDAGVSGSLSVSNLLAGEAMIRNLTVSGTGTVSLSASDPFRNFTNAGVVAPISGLVAATRLEGGGEAITNLATWGFGDARWFMLENVGGVRAESNGSTNWWAGCYICYSRDGTNWFWGNGTNWVYRDPNQYGYGVPGLAHNTGPEAENADFCYDSGTGLWWLCYPDAPYDNDSKAFGFGVASSPDLLHWTQQCVWYPSGQFTNLAPDQTHVGVFALCGKWFRDDDGSLYWVYPLESTEGKPFYDADIYVTKVLNLGALTNPASFTTPVLLAPAPEYQTNTQGVVQYLPSLVNAGGTYQLYMDRFTTNDSSLQIVMWTNNNLTSQFSAYTNCALTGKRISGTTNPVQEFDTVIKIKGRQLRAFAYKESGNTLNFFSDSLDNGITWTDWLPMSLAKWLDGNMCGQNPGIVYMPPLVEQLDKRGYSTTNLVGVVSPTNLAAGTASSSTYLRGDQQWATVTSASGVTTNFNVTNTSLGTLSLSFSNGLLASCQVVTNYVFAPTSISGLAYYWNFTDAGATNSAVISWADRVSGVVLTNYAANCPSNTASGVYFTNADSGAATQWLTNAVFNIASNYTLWCRFTWTRGNSDTFCALLCGSYSAVDGFYVNAASADTSAPLLNYFGGARYFGATIARSSICDLVYANGTVYTNGGLAGVLTGSNIRSTAQPFLMMGNDPYGESFCGYIQTVGIWTNKALTVSDVTNLWKFQP